MQYVLFLMLVGACERRSSKQEYSLAQVHAGFQARATTYLLHQFPQILFDVDHLSQEMTCGKRSLYLSPK
jgi:hypothetical protein